MQKRSSNRAASPMKANTFFYGLAIVSERAASFLIIPILTKTLPQELYAIWAQIIITAGMLSPLMVWGFHTSMIRFLSGENSTRMTSSIFHGMTIIICLNICVVIAATFFFTPSLSKLIFGNAAYSGFVRLFGLFLAAEVLFETIISFLRSQNQIKLLSVYSFLKNTARLTILILTLIVFKGSFFYCILFTILALLCLDLFMYIAHVARKVGFCMDIQDTNWKEIIYFSLPLVPYSIFVLGSSFTDRYLILASLGIKQVGTYAVAYALAGITGLFYIILGFTLYPHAAKFWNNGDKKNAAAVIGKGVGYYLFFAVPIIAILAILNKPLVMLISTPQYVSDWKVVFFLAMAIGLFGLHQFNIYPLLFANRTKSMLLMSAAALFLNILLNLLLIPRVGILGAAIAAFASNALLTALTVIIARKYLAYRFPLYIISKIVLSTTAMSLFLLTAAHCARIDTLFKLFLTILLGIAIYVSLDLINKNSFLMQLKGAL